MKSFNIKIVGDVGLEKGSIHTITKWNKNRGVFSAGRKFIEPEWLLDGTVEIIGLNESTNESEKPVEVVLFNKEEKSLEVVGEQKKSKREQELEVYTNRSIETAAKKKTRIAYPSAFNGADDGESPGEVAREAENILSSISARENSLS